MIDIKEQLNTIQISIQEIGKQIEVIKTKVEGQPPPIKILIGTPICKNKMYSWEEYVDAIKKIKMPYRGVEANVLIVDTSNDAYIRELVIKENFMYEVTSLNIEKPMDKVVAARNLIFKYANKNNYNYVLFIDSDVIAPPETIIRLLSHKKEFVTGFYPIPNFYGMPVPCAKYLAEGLFIDYPAEKIDGLLHVVDLTGLGLTLINQRLFWHLFRCERDEFGGIKKSEDICFCSDIKKIGCEVCFDSGLIAKHKTIGAHWDENA